MGEDVGIASPDHADLLGGQVQARVARGGRFPWWFRDLRASTSSTSVAGRAGCAWRTPMAVSDWLAVITQRRALARQKVGKETE